MAGTRDQLKDQLLESAILPFDIPTTTADTEIVSRPCLLVGWSLIETTGSAGAKAEFFAAQGTQGPRVGESNMASGTSDTQTLAAEGVLCEGGVNLHVISGSVRGVVYARV